MACSLKSATSFSVSGSNECINKHRVKGSLSFSPSNETFAKALDVSFAKDLNNWNVKNPSNFSVYAQSSYCVSKSMRWWEKTLKPNMVEIHSAKELVDSLMNAGDRLVIIDFYSPGCGGCKSLHPKICQLAETNPNAMFLKVNYEEMRTMCQSLHIHVLPFFRFYTGAEGKVCSFSCTSATIKKFKDALGKYGGMERSNSGPAKGLDDFELMALASAGQLPKNYALNNDVVGDFVIQGMDLYSPSNKDDNKLGLVESNAFVMA